MHVLLKMADQFELNQHNKQFLHRTDRKIKVYHSHRGLEILDEGYFSVG